MDECKPLPDTRRRRQRLSATAAQGLTIAHFKAQREDPRDTSLTLELNLSTFGPHPPFNMGHMGNKAILS